MEGHGVPKNQVEAYNGVQIWRQRKVQQIA